MQNSIDISLSVDIESTNPLIPLGVEAWLDNEKLYDSNWVKEPVSIEHTVSDSEANHELRLVLKNKLPNHTKIDEHGNIIEDALLMFKNFKLDGIELGQIVYQNATYTHNFNGNGELVTEKFLEQVGCNGTVTLKFTTPVYLWLLENM
jgi:hypothetical protein